MQAQIDVAHAQLDELVHGPRSETIDAQRAQVRDFAAQMARLEAQQLRRQTLRERQVISAEELERSTFELQSVRARWERRRRALDELEAGTRQEQIRAQQAVLAQLQAALERIEIDLQDSSLQCAIRRLDHTPVD